jgi:hypothetical protein
MISPLNPAAEREYGAGKARKFVQKMDFASSLAFDSVKTVTNRDIACV